MRVEQSSAVAVPLEGKFEAEKFPAPGKKNGVKRPTLVPKPGQRKLPHLVVINDFSVAKGGATGLALVSMRRLHKRGVKITYIVGDSGKDVTLPNDIEVVALGGVQLIEHSKVGAATNGLYNHSAARLLKEWVAANDTPNTVYHIHGWSKILSPSIFSALEGVEHRTLTHAHDFFLACPNGAFMDYRKMEPCHRKPLGVSCLTTHCDKRSYGQKLWRSARQTVLNRTFAANKKWGGVMMIHRKMKPYLFNAGIEQVELITVPNPASPFSETRIPVEKNKRLFFVGRVVEEKGVIDLIHAAQKVGCALTVIGDGTALEELKIKFPDVDFKGWLGREEIAELIKDARALVMPSRYPEPFGLVVPEASMSGIPIVISKTAFLADDIEEQQLGFAFEPQNIAHLAAQLERIMSMPEADIKAMSERAYAGNSICLHVEAWIDLLLKNYTELAEV